MQKGEEKVHKLNKKSSFYSVNKQGNFTSNLHISKEICEEGVISSKLSQFVIKLSKFSPAVEQLAEAIYKYDSEWIDYMVTSAFSIGNKELAQNIEMAKRINMVKKVANFKLAYTMGELDSYMANLSEKSLKELAEELSANEDDLGDLCVQTIFQELSNRNINKNAKNETVKLALA